MTEQWPTEADCNRLARETAAKAIARIGELEAENAKLRAACEAVLAAINRADLNGEVLWIRPPHQLPFVHESATERLMEVLGVVSEGITPCGLENWGPE